MKQIYALKYHAIAIFSARVKLLATNNMSMFDRVREVIKNYTWQDHKNGAYADAPGCQSDYRIAGAERYGQIRRNHQDRRRALYLLYLEQREK